MDWFLYDRDLRHKRVNELLQKNISETTHRRNLQVLATEFFKVNMKMTPMLIGELLKKNCSQFA